MQTKIDQLNYKAQRYWHEIAYSLEGINGRVATEKDILNYILTTLCDIEEIVGDPIIFIGENKKTAQGEPEIIPMQPSDRRNGQILHDPEAPAEQYKTAPAGQQETK